MNVTEVKQDFSTENLDTLQKFGTVFQNKAIAGLLIDKSFLEQTFDIIVPHYFESEANKWVVETIINYYNQYKDCPTLEVFKKEVDKLNNDKNEELLRVVVIEQLREIYKHVKNNDLQYFKDEFLEFCKNQAIKNAILRGADLVQRGKYEDIKGMVDRAMRAGQERNIGHNWNEDLEVRVSKVSRQTIPTPWACVNEILDGGLGPGELGCIISPSGCHARGTSILLHSGLSKLVEDICVGDMLMGPDGSPRRVLNLIRGNEVMYRITTIKGESFVVNENHILSLRRSGETSAQKKIVNISVQEYIKKSRSFKNIHKLYKSNAIEFGVQRSPFPLDPYFLGLLLGDGSLKPKNLSITTTDTEIVDAINVFAEQYRCHTSKFTKPNNAVSSYSISRNIGTGIANPVAQYLRDMGLFGLNSIHKFIPHQYKVASVQDRLSLLAGLIDTDGSRHGSVFDICLGSEQLIDDIIFIARSVGLHAIKKTRMIKGKVYFRTRISGNTNIIPCRVPQKQCPLRKQIKNVLHHGFTIERLTEDEFFGFTLDKDHLYLDANFFVHHNSGKSWILRAIAAEALRMGKRVVDYTFELSENYVGLRYDTIFTGLESKDIKNHIKYTKQCIEDIEGELIIKYFPTRTASVNHLSAHINRMIQLGYPPDLVIIDYADLMRATERTNAKHEELGLIYEEIRGLLGELKIPGWTVSQSQRSALNDNIIEADKVAGAYSKIFVADVVMSMSRNLADKVNNTAKFHVIKNRFGPDGMTYPSLMDLRYGKIELYDENSPDGMKIKNMMTNGNGQINAILRKKLLDLNSTNALTADEIEITSNIFNETEEIE